MKNDFFSDEYFTYTVVNGRARLCSYHGFDMVLTIPKTLGGYAVSCIGWGAFLQCKTLVKVVIPNSVMSIDGSAFYGCKKLRWVEIPDSVINIGEMAFGKCLRLADIKISETHPVYSFFEGALFNKVSGTLLSYFGGKGLLTYVVPDFVTSIAHGAFLECSTLREVVISDSVCIIESMAFYGCRRLKRVLFGSSVTSIGRGAFCECRKLRKVRLPVSVVRVGQKAFRRGGWVILMHMIL